ncbi:MAG TPA: CBS domain-containing protein [Candidatus Limnocylindrales bacterium]|nr:CBS domain-containing protein [Candidatus Limnocylindrales bacterium]
MICPVCGHDNLQGEDSCANCGADLAGIDLPRPSTTFERHLVADALATLRPRRPLTVRRDTPAAEAIATMQTERIGCLLVTDGPEDHLVGVFTERDALLRLGDRPLQSVTIGEVMTADPVVLRGEDTVGVAIHKMAVGGFRHIPLVVDGQATGVVSARDLFHHVVGILDQRSRGAAAQAGAEWPFSPVEPAAEGRSLDESPTMGGAPA